MQKTFKIQNSAGNIVELPIEYKDKIQELITNEDYQGIDNMLQELPSMQMGGMFEDEATKTIRSVIEALSQGADPQEIFQSLVSKGYTEEQAQAVIEEAIQTAQEQMQEQPQYEEEENEDMYAPEYAYGGMIYSDMFGKPSGELLIAEEGKEIKPYALEDDQTTRRA